MSLGLFTNIEEAIKRASEDWRGAPEKYHRHMILLTDGMVDISKRSEPSQASRARIIEQLIPRLQGLGARVHTIALSDKADHGLMRQLATASGGWHEQVDNAEQLQRIFLRMFEKVGQPDTLPLKDNRFVVDASIEEVTLLVFRDEGAAPTRIVPAAGDAFDAASAPAGVSWHRDEGYDLLTIAGPVPGEWRIEAAADPDNRVMVVTQLKMRTSDAPATLGAGEPLPLQIRFTDRDELITDQGFLDVLQVQVQTFDADGPSEPRPVMDNGEGGDEKAGDALFGTALETEMSPGKVELVIRAEGKTFARERRQYFELEAAPEPVVYATLDVAEQVQIGKPGIMVRVLPNDEVLARDAVEVSATLESDQGEGQPVMFLPGIDGNQEVWIDQSLLQGQWRLSVNLRGLDKAGEALDVMLDPVPIEGKYVEPPPPPEPEPEPEPAAQPEPAPEPEPEPEAEEPPAEWLMVSLVFGGVNLLLVVVGGLVFWLARRGRRDDLVRLVDEAPEQGGANG
ncbi:MAG: hypothetical protein B0D89_12365 [Candidatus Sedimenticola endophacoides]|nr:MAG: hypothetical protein B0D94_00070 [Candidatus Sedimenticola endophacoides]OQX38639.1 MAG: hypothetical protein B0D89_12365 [Candidatus Sedimenticola endophacoides]